MNSRFLCALFFVGGLLSSKPSHAVDGGPETSSSVENGADLESGPPVPAAALVAAESPTRVSSGPGVATERTKGSVMGIVGCLLLVGCALLLSEVRRKIPWRTVAIGFLLQIVFAVFVLKTAAGRALFDAANGVVKTLLSFSQEGARFLFGNLAGMSVPVTDGTGAALGLVAKTGALMAFSVLPTIVFFSMLSAVLNPLGVLQRVVQVLGFVMRRAMGTSGAESLAAAANIFLGQTESPLLVRPFLPTMTRSELMALMTGGFATVAGGVMAAYVGMLEGRFPDIAGHLVAASVMSAPASLVIAKIMVPETEVPTTREGAVVHVQRTDANLLDAASRGTSEGLTLALNVGAMLIAFTALIPLVNWLLQSPGVLCAWVGLSGGAAFFEALSLQSLFGALFAPLAFLLGVPWADAGLVGSLMGTKTVINEFVAYLQLSSALEAGQLHDPRSVVIATYALCGFSNFASIGIQLGGLAVIAPERRAALAALGLRAMIGASLACFLTGAIAGVLL
ncbi:MAG: NupC/NupG family nucleoside CNT transporter [Myxococcota bacterium]